MTIRSPTDASDAGDQSTSDQQRSRYRGRNVVERCFNKLKQWRGIAMRSDKTARNYHAGLCLAATLHWLGSGVVTHPVIDTAVAAAEAGSVASRACVSTS